MWSQVGFAFRSVENALTIIVRNLESFSGLAAETERLDALATGLPPHDATPSPSILPCMCSNMDQVHKLCAFLVFL